MKLGLRSIRFFGVVVALFAFSASARSSAALDTAATLELAGKYYEIGNYAKAQPLYERLVKETAVAVTDLPDIYYRLGRCHHYSDQTDSAISCFQIVGDKYPKAKVRDVARKWLGDCYVLREQFDTAISVYRSILRNYSDKKVAAEANFELAVTLFKMQDYESAETEFKSFISKYPAHALVKQARFYLKRIQNIRGS